MLGRLRGGVFLSYARKDGEQFAARLRGRLKQQAPYIQIKQDRLLLEGGVGWWKQLTGAIDAVDFLILVMSRSAMESDIVRKEWRYARQQGVCVYPVKAAPDSELRFSQLPRWMTLKLPKASPPITRNQNISASQLHELSTVTTLVAQFAGLC